MQIPAEDRPAPVDLGPPIRIGWSGFFLIVGFWTFFGIVMAASLLLSPLRVSAAAPSAVIAFTFLGAYAWAALTPPLLRLTRHFDLARDGGVQRILRILILLGFSLLLAIIVSVGLSVISSLLLQDLLDGSLAGRAGMWRLARYRFLNDLLACDLVLTAGLARQYFLWYRARQHEATLLRAQLVQARLEVLRSQLNPHFLFNTLNAVAALVTKDPRGVRRMIACLSDLLRHTLNGAGEPEVPVARELEILKQYLEIINIRFRDHLQTSVTAAPDVLDALVPSLILQPLVENAMKHGVGRASTPGRIEVEVFREEAEVVLTVWDTGCGRAEPSMGSIDNDSPVAIGSDVGDRPRREEAGLGLRHTRERLRQLYGDAARLSLGPSARGGTLAELRIPHRTRPVPHTPMIDPVPSAGDSKEDLDRAHAHA